MRTPPARSMLPSLLLTLLSGLQPAAASTRGPLDGAGQTVRRAVGASALDTELRWAGAFDALGRPVAEQDDGLAPKHDDYDTGLLAAEYFVDVDGALGDDGRVDYLYDPAGRLARSTSALGVQTFADYSAAGAARKARGPGSEGSSGRVQPKSSGAVS